MSKRSADLYAAYGSGPVKNAGEVAEFQAQMRATGMTSEEACVVGAWMGGAPAEHFAGFKVWEATWRQTAPEACDSSKTVAEAMAVLAKLDIDLYQLVDAKATGKQYKEAKNEAENVKQDVDAIKDKVAKAVSIDVAGLSIGPKQLLIGGLCAVGLFGIWRLASAARAVAG